MDDYRDARFYWIGIFFESIFGDSKGSFKKVFKLMKDDILMAIHSYKASLFLNLSS